MVVVRNAFTSFRTIERGFEPSGEVALNVALNEALNVAFNGERSFERSITVAFNKETYGPETVR